MVSAIIMVFIWDNMEISCHIIGIWSGYGTWRRGFLVHRGIPVYPQFIIHFRMGFSLINQPLLGTPIHGKPHWYVVEKVRIDHWLSDHSTIPSWSKLICVKKKKYVDHGWSYHVKRSTLDSRPQSGRQHTVSKTQRQIRVSLRSKKGTIHGCSSPQIW